MDARKAEALYLSNRVSASLAMAATAAGPCARIAHLTLARLYAEAIDPLPSTVPTAGHLIHGCASRRRSPPGP